MTHQSGKPLIVSACLLGQPVRYNGVGKPNDFLISLQKSGRRIIAVCPEEMGGLATPRPPSEIADASGEDVLDGKACVKANTGADVTAEFVAGAEKVLKLALEAGADCAVMKAKSPSCGCNRIYDGTFSGNVKPGNGVTTAILKRHGISVMTEEDSEALQQLS
ncbi:MAG: DUF523 domain-containing protein [Neisseria sp.]|nr:DUF523 domain-containing protein [Neisseria sp.]